jgi:hypothetical protein
MNTLVARTILLISVLFFSTCIFAQYPVPAGQPGTSAMYRDSTAFIGWASSCIIERGYVDISDTNFIEVVSNSNKTTYGNDRDGTGPADEMVVSLGDHGSALLGFSQPIVNHAGPDFAVFENSFGDSFLELGFVEVSSDGQRFVRFPAVSLTPDNQQVSTFDTIDATKIHNFAGKYRHSYGTPFDLEDIRDSSGIDLNNIIFVRIIDVVGCLQDPFASFDSQGHKVNEPWPTPFNTGGFDLDAVGAIHNKADGINDEHNQSTGIHFYPNPVANKVTFESSLDTKIKLKISDLSGIQLLECVFSNKADFDLTSFPAGIYIATVIFKDGTSIIKKIIKY